MSEANQETEDIIAMREDERVDPEVVGRFLAGKLPGAEGTPEMLQFGGGKANLTYLVRYPGHDYVLRRPPLGPVAPKSHDMGREYRVLSVLYQAFPLAPRAFLFSEDTSVVGAPFLVMERREGIVIRQEMPATYANRPDLYRRLSEALVDALVAFHAVDPASVGLEKLGRPEGYMERQIEGWFQRWEAAKTSENKKLDEVVDWLRRRIPAPIGHTLVHNDYKLDNMMVNAGDIGKPVAIFDWDMCTLGDPLADLGGLLGYWTEAGDSDDRTSFRVMPSHLEGFYTRAQLAERYAEKSGHDLPHIDFYETFALFKVAVVIQQIYVRFVRGQTQDRRFQDYDKRVNGLVDAAWSRMS